MELEEFYKLSSDDLSKMFFKMRDEYLLDVKFDNFWATKIINEIVINITPTDDPYDCDGYEEWIRWTAYEAFLGIELCLKTTGRLPLLNERFSTAMDDTTYLKITSITFGSSPLFPEENSVDYEVSEEK